MLPQVRELLTRYGPICSIWFDNPIVITPEQSRELCALVKELQPDCLVNSRIGNALGDYHSFGDNEVPSAPISGAGETIATLNDTWGYKHFDRAWKSSRELLGILTSLAGTNTNYVLNIGPMADGQFPAEAVRILGELAVWARGNAEAIHGTRQSPFPYSQPWGVITARQGTDSSTLYCCLREANRTSLTLNGVRNTLLRAYEPATPAAALRHTRTAHGVEVELPATFATPDFPVIAVELRGALAVDTAIMPQDGGVIDFPAALATVHAEGLPEEAVPVLAPTGIMTNWFDTRAWLSWSFTLPAPGTYRVEVITSALHHSATWHGGHRVHLAAGDACCTATLACDAHVTTPETRYYPQAISRCGLLHLSEPGACTLTLTAQEIAPIPGVGLALVAVRLYMA